MKILMERPPRNSSNAAGKNKLGAAQTKSTRLVNDQATALKVFSESLAEFSALKEEPTPDGFYISDDWIANVIFRFQDAVKQHKVFVMYNENEALRAALVRRGWVEKANETPPQKVDEKNKAMAVIDVCNLLPAYVFGEDKRKYMEECTRIIGDRLLQHVDADFRWDMGVMTTVPRSTIINRIAKSCFTSKSGLCAMLQQMQWFTEDEIAFTQFPRCYHTSLCEQLQAFIDDFRLTACMSMLRHFIHTYDTHGLYAVQSYVGSLPVSSLSFAIARCNDYISKHYHEDIDMTHYQVWGQEWDHFLTDHHLFVHKKQKFIDKKEYRPLIEVKEEAMVTLNKMAVLWPQYSLDGLTNLWIIKPGNKSKETSIIIMNNFTEIFPLLSPLKETKYVVQKYIETPLLICETKFDIRQWFLVTSVQPLIIWMYRDCYIRFASQKFNVDNLHESVHLCNYAVQSRYQNCENRNASLPECNMWDSMTFRNYLEENGHASEWHEIIYPGMRQAIVGAMLAAQDNMSHRVNSFELYGADFILNEEFEPWLLEINASPCMSQTTPVTSRLCSECLEDLVKVVIDRRQRPVADTGKFDLVYKQLPNQPANLQHIGLSVQGKKLSPPIHCKMLHRKSPSNAKGGDNNCSTIDQSNDVESPSHQSVTCIALGRRPAKCSKRVYLIHPSRATAQIPVKIQCMRKYTDKLDMKKTERKLLQNENLKKGTRCKGTRDIVIDAESLAAISSDCNFAPPNILASINRMMQILRKKLPHSGINVIFTNKQCRRISPPPSLLQKIVAVKKPTAVDRSPHPTNPHPIHATEGTVEINYAGTDTYLNTPGVLGTVTGAMTVQKKSPTKNPTEGRSIHHFNNQHQHRWKLTSQNFIPPSNSFSRELRKNLNARLIQTIFEKRRHSNIPDNVMLHLLSVDKHLQSIIKPNSRIPPKS